MKRRDVLTFFAVAAADAALPPAVRAQPSDRVRRIGILMSVAADDQEAQGRLAALLQQLKQLGWIEGSNVQVVIRWSGGDFVRMRKDAGDLIALGPDVIVAAVGPTAAVLQQATHTIPTVFTQAVDPVGAGFVQSLARPGGNMTGFTQFEYGLSAKWLELLREIAPQVSLLGVARDAVDSNLVGIGQWAIIQAAASLVSLETTPINLQFEGETERTLSAFARKPNSGLIVAVGTTATIQHALIIALAARYRLPTVYHNRLFVDAGGLISYGPNLVDNYRRAAGYVDRILKGEKPADLPVQAPTKYELVLNMKTAKALGLTVPPALIARADEVIE